MVKQEIIKKYLTDAMNLSLHLQTEEKINDLAQELKQQLEQDTQLRISAIRLSVDSTSGDNFSDKLKNAEEILKFLKS